MQEIPPCIFGCSVFHSSIHHFRESGDIDTSFTFIPALFKTVSPASENYLQIASLVSPVASSIMPFYQKHLSRLFWTENITSSKWQKEVISLLPQKTKNHGLILILTSIFSSS